MENTEKNKYEELTNLESIKKFCSQHLSEFATDSFHLKDNLIRIRYIDLDGKFNYVDLGRFFFVDDCMYVMTKESRYKKYHNPDILEFDKELEVLRYMGFYIVRGIFAGVFTGFFDDKGNRIFTGDVVNAQVFIFTTRLILSKGGYDRAVCVDKDERASDCTAGVNDINGSFSLIFDNHYLPLSQATKLEVIGSLFYDLRSGHTELDIRSLCNEFAQLRYGEKDIFKLIRKSPYFPPQTWQEEALELICGSDDDE